MNGLGKVFLKGNFNDTELSQTVIVCSVSNKWVSLFIFNQKSAFDTVLLHFVYLNALGINTVLQYIIIKITS